MKLISLKAEKTVALFGWGRASVTVDVFNVTNANTVLLTQREQNSSRANMPRTILAPRVARIGVRFTW